MPNTNVSSDSGDVDAVMAIKEWYNVKRNWMGDPCVPEAYAWGGLNCTFNISGFPRITSVDLSHSELNGEITAAFANLSEIQYLDLSYNLLTGSIPDLLAHLPSLKLLDLTNNQLSGRVPSAVLTKSQNGSLTLRIGGNQNICVSVTSCERKPKKKTTSTIIVISCVVPIMFLLMVVLILCILRKQREGSYIMRPNECTLQIDTRRFTYMELKKITRNFERTLGKGGFGIVYYGYLEDDGTEVAVKMLSHTSEEEFVAEAQHLSRVHHKNLVAMIGYCTAGDHLALVYEYMSQGTLKEHLRGSSGIITLSWGQRLQIALEAAQGLEYLHTGCKPPLIHRDVKTVNILLSERLEAKISDFGLSKAFENDEHSHVSTRVVGTPGYLDPEYYIKNQLSEKSDVYSFGVVLLEIITGQPPILNGVEKTHIAEWVYNRLVEGKMKDVIDERLRGEYDVDSAWKIAFMALNCATGSSSKRPTMSEVVMQLKEIRSALQSSAHDHTTECEKASCSTENLRREHNGVLCQIDAFECASISDKDGPSAR